MAILCIVLSTIKDDKVACVGLTMDCHFLQPQFETLLNAARGNTDISPILFAMHASLDPFPNKLTAIISLCPRGSIHFFVID
jgi:hypothetical protein